MASLTSALMIPLGGAVSPTCAITGGQAAKTVRQLEKQLESEDELVRWGGAAPVIVSDLSDTRFRATP